MNVHVMVLFLLIYSIGTSSGQCHFGCVYNECNDAGDCTQGCKTGYQGVKCDTCTSCLLETCSDTGYCTYGCYKASVYGDKCDQPCPDQCSECDRDYNSTGVCITCAVGYYGQACEKQCPAKCYIGSCDKVSGDCKYGCVSGYSGPMCTDCAIGYYRVASGCTACSVYCQSCTNSSLCDTCHDGFYGSGCQQFCSPGCRSVKCGRYDGTCDVCQPGYKGTHCDQCSDNYYKYSAICIECAANCEQCSSALSCTSCSPGHYGQLCQNQCAAGCQTITCIKTDGSCQCMTGFKGLTCSLCVDGKYGDNCDKDCNTVSDPSCTVACNTTCFEQRCDSKTGKCASGCIVGYHGEWCETRCSDNCVDNAGDSSCDSFSGLCRFGCNRGYFGLTCENKCGANCLNEICARETGDCIGGCKPGLKGNDCTQGSDLDQGWSGEVNTGVVAGATVGTVVVILLVVVIIVLVVKLRRKTVNNEKPKTTNVATAPAQTNVAAMSDTDYAYIRDADIGFTVAMSAIDYANIRDADIASRPSGRVVTRATPGGATNRHPSPTPGPNTSIVATYVGVMNRHPGPNIAVAPGQNIVVPGDREYWEPDASEYEQPDETAAVHGGSDRRAVPNTISPGQDIVHVVREDGECMQPDSGCMHTPSSGTCGDGLNQTQTDGNVGLSEKPAYDRLVRDQDMSDDPRYDQLKADFIVDGSYMYGRIGSEGAQPPGSTQPFQSVA